MTISNYTTFLVVVEVFVGKSLQFCAGRYRLGQVSLIISASLCGVVEDIIVEINRNKMKIPEKTKLLELYSYGIESFVLNLQDYLKTNNKVSELKYHIGHKLAEISDIISNYN